MIDSPTPGPDPGPTTITCDSGYTYNSGSCVKTYAATLINGCPTGYVVQGSSCLLEQTPTCNNEYTFNTSTKKCEKTVPATTTYTGGTWSWKKIYREDWEAEGIFEKYSYLTFVRNKREYCSERDSGCDGRFETGSVISIRDCGTCDNSTLGETCLRTGCGHGKSACEVTAGAGSQYCIDNNKCNGRAIATKGYLREFDKCVNTGGTKQYSCTDSDCTLSGNNCNCSNTSNIVCSVTGSSYNSSTGKCESTISPTSNYDCQSGNTHAGATVTLTGDTCTSTYVPN